MYFVDRKKIVKNLEYMEELINTYEQSNDWLEDRVHRLAVERIANILIEAIIDVGNSMIDGFIMRDPGSYEDIIDILVDESVITSEMDEPLKELIGLRRGLVRDILDVIDEEVVNVLTKNLAAIKEFSPKVKDYLTNELGPVTAFIPEGEE
ncbi:type VII toxin-antitoxin system HepT family RNase toxin [Rummeliibacillus sp. BSL5]